MVIDIYSRYVPGWLLAPREDAKLAEQLLGDTCFKQDIDHGQLSVHADRGSSMASKTVAFLLADLGVTKSHSRPHVSNDNPFSEAQFKTLKYRPDFPDRFDSIEHARTHVRDFFGWYDHAHRHPVAWAGHWLNSLTRHRPVASRMSSRTPTTPSNPLACHGRAGPLSG